MTLVAIAAKKWYDKAWLYKKLYFNTVFEKCQKILPAEHVVLWNDLQIPALLVEFIKRHRASCGTQICAAKYAEKDYPAYIYLRRGCELTMERGRTLLRQRT